MEKKCTKCNEIKSINDYSKYKFKPRKDGTQKIGIRSYCNKCKNQMTKDWFDKNKGYKKKWRKENPDKVRQENLNAKPRTDKWRKENKYTLKIKKREYRLKNIDYIKKNKPIEARKARKELQDCYVIGRITRDSNLKASDIRKHPELIEAKRIIIKTKRLWRTSQN
mgnify:CR=1 FL=1|tara:strand:+ start:51 stop:548 length:498 start_codon:yes stop_codon:yes gene_type:complete